MSIAPKCFSCKMELIKFGGILISPPNANDFCKKLHICTVCWERIIREVEDASN